MSTSQTVFLNDSAISFECSDNDTILRAALRQGIGFPYECNVGSCGNCKFELLTGTVSSDWPDAPGRSEKDKSRNRHLACQCRALGPVTVKVRTSEKYRPVHPPQKATARLISKRQITHDIAEFSFELDEPVPFESGQYALLQLPGVTGPRAYSMSNAGSHGSRVEFQVRKTPQGAGTHVLFEGIKSADAVGFDGPYGMAFLRKESTRPIICIAGGSGLAPMISIARDALSDPVRKDQQLHFLYGARMPEDVCGLDMLQPLAHWTTAGHYHAAVSGLAPDQSTPVGMYRGFVHELLDSLHGPDLAMHEIYFAGPAPMAQALLKLLIDRNVPTEQIHFDQFY